MFTIDEKIILISLVESVLLLEESNLRNLHAVQFKSNSKAQKLAKKVNNLKLIRGKLEQLK